MTVSTGVTVRLGHGVIVGDHTQCAARSRSADMQRSKRLRLHDLDQTLAHQLEQRHEGNRNPHAPFAVPEQADEFYETRLLQRSQNVTHPRAH